MITTGGAALRSSSCKVATEQADHFVANDLDELLLRREALEHFLTHRFGFDRVEESLDDFNVDIGFE